MSAQSRNLGFKFLRTTNSPMDAFFVTSLKIYLDRFAHGGMFVSLTYEGQLMFCQEDETLYIFKKDSEGHFYYEPAQTSLGFEEVSLQLDGEIYSPDLGEDDPLTGTIYKASGTFEDQEVTKYYHWQSEWIEIPAGFFGSGGDVDDATTTTKGIVQLSDATDESELGTNDKVITETVLKTVMPTDAYSVDYNDTTVGDALDDIEDALDILLSEV